MKLIHRFGYYLGGFAMGLVILAFFFSGKKTSCDYFPDARVMKNIREKHRVYSEEAMTTFKINQIDTSVVSEILKTGDVNFSRSEAQRDPCGIYLVTGRTKLHNLELLFENCDTVATLKQVKVVK